MVPLIPNLLPVIQHTSKTKLFLPKHLNSLKVHQNTKQKKKTLKGRQTRAILLYMQDCNSFNHNKTQHDMTQGHRYKIYSSGPQKNERQDYQQRLKETQVQISGLAQRKAGYFQQQWKFLQKMVLKVHTLTLNTPDRLSLQ